MGAMTTLTAGDPAPDFTLPDPDGTEVTLSSLRGRDQRDANHSHDGLGRARHPP